MNLGILGFAHGHCGIYCTQWREHPELGIEVVAGWDHDGERLARAAREHNIPARENPEQVLEGPEVDAVVIAAETNRHAELVERAAEAGKAIILQKPIALSLEDADRIVAAVDRSGVSFTLAWQMRVDPENLKVKDLIESGALGKLFMLRRRHTLGICLEESNLGLWHFDAEANRDIWADDACHAIDFVLWLLGPPESVTAELSTLLHPAAPNDNGIAIFRYPGGPIAEVCCSFTCMAGENTLELTAENGVVVQNFGDAPSAPLRPPGTPALKWRFTGDADWRHGEFPVFRHQGERIANLAQPLADFLHGRRPPLATAREGRETLRLVLACYEASERGARVQFPPQE